jgi:hypothetical protein
MSYSKFLAFLSKFAHLMNSMHFGRVLVHHLTTLRSASVLKNSFIINYFRESFKN